jgi:hypothetical protein
MYRWPPTDGTTSSATESTVADVNSLWTISGASYGNGQYKAQASITAVNIDNTAYHAFDSNLTAGFESTSASTGTLQVEFPTGELATIRKYVVWPVAADGTRPSSWTLQGYDGSVWSTLHTVASTPPSLSGDALSVTYPAAYNKYRLDVTANAGGSGLKVAELALWGDIPFDITFNDGWTPASGVTTLTIGQTYTLPGYTTSAYGVTVTGTIDVNTVGTYDIVYTYVEDTGLVKRVVRRYIVE